jgi:Tfp pilus assembly protein PilF
LRRIIPLGLLCLALGACALQRPYASKNMEQPNFRSIYYYLVGSYFQHEGDAATADELFREALSNDPGSPGIRKQLLVNAFTLYRLGELDAPTLQDMIEDHKRLGQPDEDLLYAFYTFYEAVADSNAMRETVLELQQLYPGPRSYIQRFIFELRGTGIPRTEFLDSAQVMAEKDPEYFQVLARIWSYYDPAKEKQALLRYFELSPGETSHTLLADYILGNQDAELAKWYFGTLVWPEDRDYMEYLVTAPWLPQANPLAIQLADGILATGDLTMIESLALSSLIGNRPDLLLKVKNELEANPAPPADKQPLYALLAAHSIQIGEKWPLEDFLAHLSETKFYDEVLSYYNFAVNKSISDTWTLADPQAYQAFRDQLASRLPDAPPARYLDAIAVAVQDTLDSSFIDRKHDLAIWLRDRGVLSAEDYEFLLGYFQLREDNATRRLFLEEAVREYPDNATFSNDLGYTMLVGGEDPDTAAGLVRRALAQEPENPYYLDSLAWYHYLKGEYEQALDLSRIPMEMEEQPAEIAWHISAILLALEDNAGARVWLEKCISIGNDPNATAQAQKALKLIP